MIDRETVNYLAAELSRGVEEGMKNGAAHIAEALANVPHLTGKVPHLTGKVRADGAAVVWNEVTSDEVLQAVRTVVVNNTYFMDGCPGLMLGKRGTHSIAVQLDAWTTLRRALGMPT